MGSNMDSLPAELADCLVILAPVLRQTCWGYLRAADRLLDRIIAKYSWWSVRKGGKTVKRKLLCGGRSYLRSTILHPVYPIHQPLKQADMSFSLTREVCLLTFTYDVGRIEVVKIDPIHGVKYELKAYGSYEPLERGVAALRYQDDVRFTIKTRVFSCEYIIGRDSVRTFAMVAVARGELVETTEIALARVIDHDRLFKWFNATTFDSSPLGFPQILAAGNARG